MKQNRDEIPSTDTPQVEGFQALVVYRGAMYRTAGIRIPLAGEQYVGKDGKIHTRSELTGATMSERLVVRPIVSLKAVMEILSAAGTIIKDNLNS